MSKRHGTRQAWLDAWHYARYDLRHGQLSQFIDPELRRLAKVTMEGQGRDMLAVRSSMQRSTGPREAFLLTSACARG